MEPLSRRDEAAGHSDEPGREHMMSSERSQPGHGDRDAGNRFETVMRGYDKRQVEDYVAWLGEQLSAMQADLTETRRKLDAAREDSAALRQQLQTRPPHEQVSARMAEILRLAQEEAEQEREKAAEQAADILEQTQAKAAEVIEEARSDAAQMTRETQGQCEDQLASAQAKVAQLLETAQRQAEATLTEAGERSRRVLTDVDQRSRQITSLQQRRLAAVLAAHHDVKQRLEDAGRLIDEQLGQDREQGDPAAAVDPEVLPTLGPAIQWATSHPSLGTDAPAGPPATVTDTTDVRESAPLDIEDDAAVRGSASPVEAAIAGRRRRVDHQEERSLPTDDGQRSPLWP
jgi:peptidoglycan DL-endopeptidase CwlO